MTSFGNLEEARNLIARYVEDYNTKRLHSSLNFLTPDDWLKGIDYVEGRLAERRRKLKEAANRRKKQWETTKVG